MNESTSVRSAPIQQWQSYLTNRSRRHRDARFLVHGVELADAAVRNGWQVETLLYRLSGPPLSERARALLDHSDIPRIGLLPEVIAELGDRWSRGPELIAVVRAQCAELSGWEPAQQTPVVVVLLRPGAAWELGVALRDAAAFGAAAVAVVGSTPDQFDPDCVRASGGAVFRLPVFRVSDAEAVTALRDRLWRRGVLLRIVGLDDAGTAEWPAPGGGEPSDLAHDADLAHATALRHGAVLVVGSGALGDTWRAACDLCLRVPSDEPLSGSAAAVVGLYELARRAR